jgi:hypothetical protein
VAAVLGETLMELAGVQVVCRMEQAGVGRLWVCSALVGGQRPRRRAPHLLRES